MADHIALSPENVSKLCPECKATVLSLLGLASDVANESSPSETDGVGESREYAELGVQAARAFLLGCGEKTTAALRLIVEAGDEFLARDIQAKMPDPDGGLRGVWTGLTKRTRTITGTDEIDLIEWLEEQDDGSWRGRLMPMTRDSFRRALAN